MHRKWISGSVAVVGILSLAACGSDEALPTSLLAARAAVNTSTVAVVNGKMSFTSDRDGNSQIYVMNADGSGQTNLTNNSTQEIFPAWSPDATRIAFTSSRDGNYEIYVMNADGTGQTRLTNSVGTDWFAKWSPDGSKIAFAGGRTGLYEIYVMNADGTNQTQLTNSATWDYGPAWSPDGTRIVFSSQRNGAPEIYVMNADGSAQTRLTNNPASDVYPAWSPDGTKIAFTSYRDGGADIYVMNVDGTGQTRLTNTAGSDILPAWSPDGTTIAFDSDRNGTPEIYSMNADGTGQTRLTNNAAFDYGAAWGRGSVADYTYSCTGLACNFDGRISTGGTGFRWDFGDGTTGGIAVHPRTFASPGTYTVTLTTTPSGAQSVMSKTIVVSAPPASVADYVSSCTGLVCIFDGRISTGATGFQWDFGDGTTGGVAVHPRTYANPGTYTVTLRTTPLGGQSVMSRTIVVGAPPPPVGNPPVAEFTWSCAGLTCTLDASASTDDGTIAQYAWDLGRFPNPTGSGVIISAAYAHSGNRTVVLTVTDNSGQTGTITKTIVLP